MCIYDDWTSNESTRFRYFPMVVCHLYLISRFFFDFNLTIKAKSSPLHLPATFYTVWIGYSFLSLLQIVLLWIQYYAIIMLHWTWCKHNKERQRGREGERERESEGEDGEGGRGKKREWGREREREIERGREIERHASWWLENTRSSSLLDLGIVVAFYDLARDNSVSHSPVISIPSSIKSVDTASRNFDTMIFPSENSRKYKRRKMHCLH